VTTPVSPRGLDPWQLLRHGNAERGLALVREACEREQTPSHIMELGIAYLWTGDYYSAHIHLSNAIQMFPLSMSGFYGVDGIAKWCMGECSAAVDDWRTGMNAQYTDAAGLGVRLPLLLFVASILYPEVFPRKKAEQILAQKTEDARADHWPGTLAKFVLGLESAEGATEPRSVMKESDKKHREWLIRFYGHLLHFGTGNLTSTQLAELMRTATDALQQPFSDQDTFLSLMWSGEFFIARHQTQVPKTVNGL
jgi:hypothetical protein